VPAAGIRGWRVRSIGTAAISGTCDTKGGAPGLLKAIVGDQIWADLADEAEVGGDATVRAATIATESVLADVAGMEVGAVCGGPER